jgi:hypothetical protein
MVDRQAVFGDIDKFDKKMKHVNFL